MKKLNGYYQDKNDNKWNCYIYTKKEAKEYSKSMIDCNDCVDCINCINCKYCKSCNNCIDCIICDDCINCTECKRCVNCYRSFHCDNCDNCDNCKSCENCRNCISQPQIYTTPKIGSRDRETYFYYGFVKDARGKSLQVSCGCFHGNLKEFENKVVKTYGNKFDVFEETYLDEYLKEIEKVKVLFELEGENRI